MSVQPPSLNTTLPFETETEDEHAYYRSRLFTPFSGTNPMLTSAQPLLVLIGRLHHTFPLQASIQNDAFKQALAHEFKVFKTRLKHDYQVPVVRQQAESLLQQAFADTLASIDNAQTNKQNAVSTHEPAEPVLFTYIRQLLKQSELPSEDVLELAYILLTLAYHPTHPQQVLQALLEKLYARLKHKRQPWSLPSTLGNSSSRPSMIGHRLTYLLRLKPSRLAMFISSLFMAAWFLSSWDINQVSLSLIQNLHWQTS